MRVRRLVGGIAIPVAACFAILMMAIGVLARPSEGEPAFIVELFGWFLLGVALGVAFHAAAVATFGSVFRRVGDPAGRIASIATVVVFDATWITAASLIAMIDRPAAMWLVPPGIIAATLAFTSARLDLPLAVLRDPSPSARQGWQQLTEMDVRSTGVGPVGWMLALALFEGVGAAAAAMLVLHFHSLPAAAALLVALVVVDLIHLRLRTRSYRAAVAVSGLVAITGTLLFVVSR
ncbi:hypothetical protein [Agromyces arachidis]|uniref:hypothetical protein n=1 Tax=Agromyces arachidis TaxID=766966 RepID=UPI0040579CFE